MQLLQPDTLLSDVAKDKKVEIDYINVFVWI